MLVCTLMVRNKLAETRLMSQCSLHGQVAGSGQLGVHRQESMADSHCHTQSYFQATQSMYGRFRFYSDENGLYASWCCLILTLVFLHISLLHHSCYCYQMEKTIENRHRIFLPCYLCNVYRIYLHVFYIWIINIQSQRSSLQSKQSSSPPLFWHWCSDMPGILAIPRK